MLFWLPILKRGPAPTADTPRFYAPPRFHLRSYAQTGRSPSPRFAEAQGCPGEGGMRVNQYLGPPVVPFYPFLGEDSRYSARPGSPTKIDYRKRVPLFNLSTGGPRYSVRPNLPHVRNAKTSQRVFRHGHPMQKTF